MTIADCLRLSERLQAISDSPRLDIEVLLASALGKNRTYLYTWPEKSLQPEQILLFEKYLKRRQTGEPVAHILGEREFWSLPFYVNSSTLIPRPDTELLVETALEHLPAGAKVLDLGTGTGAIAIAIASERPDTRIVATDFSQDALALAAKNLERHQIKNLELKQSCWFENLDGVYDLIVSNPPYIDAEDIHLSQGDVRFEPHSALISGNKGLADIETIASDAFPFLTPGGVLMVEHGWQQGEAVRDIFTRNGFCEVKTLRDYGQNERLTLGVKSNSGV